MTKTTIQRIAAATAATWRNKRVASARRARHHVKAKGIEFTSVTKAFSALGLPLQKAKAFRQQLVAAQKARFDRIQFTLLT